MKGFKEKNIFTKLDNRDFTKDKTIRFVEKGSQQIRSEVGRNISLTPSQQKNQTWDTDF